MSLGAVIFAQNNSTIDYVKLAVYAARQIVEYLKIPVSIITDSPDWLIQSYPNHPFDKIITTAYSDITQLKIFNDGVMSSKKSEWKNYVRDQVYDLTPYDRTLVIDSDYIINSKVLLPALYNNCDFQIYKQSMDIADWRPTREFERINQFSIPFYWGTVFVFEKNDITQAFFDLIAYVKSNWLYFRNLYSIESATFRNDFAFSIAIHIMNGKTNGGFAVELPGKMIYCKDTDFLVAKTDSKMKFLVEKKNYFGEYTLAKTSGLDVHVMNKMSLSRFIDGGSGV